MSEQDGMFCKMKNCVSDIIVTFLYNIFLLMQVKMYNM